VTGPSATNPTACSPNIASTSGRSTVRSDSWSSSTGSSNPTAWIGWGEAIQPCSAIASASGQGPVTIGESRHQKASGTPTIGRPRCSPAVVGMARGAVATEPARGFVGRGAPTDRPAAPPSSGLRCTHRFGPATTRDVRNDAGNQAQNLRACPPTRFLTGETLDPCVSADYRMVVANVRPSCGPRAGPAPMAPPLTARPSTGGGRSSAYRTTASSSSSPTVDATECRGGRPSRCCSACSSRGTAKDPRG
jgi:hypothetical protein